MSPHLPPQKILIIRMIISFYLLITNQLYFDYGLLIKLKDVQRWQFLTMKAAETLHIASLPPEICIS